jgi:hypothetical protein
MLVRQVAHNSLGMRWGVHGPNLARLLGMSQPQSTSVTTFKATRLVVWLDCRHCHVPPVRASGEPSWL